jgi:hypothetical protein
MENEGQGEPPLDGAIPDMHSFTEQGSIISIGEFYNRYRFNCIDI